MLLTDKNSHTQGVLLLILTTLIWGTSFPLLKQTIESLSPAVLIAIRFTIAALLFSPWLRQLNARLIRDGGLLGLLYFGECVCTLIGLETVSASQAAFIISLNVILVPLLGWLLGRRLSIRVLAAAGIAFSGIGVMAWKGGLQTGNWWILCSAVGCALYILLLEKTTRRHPTLPLTAIQLCVMAILGMGWALPQMMGQGAAILQHFPILLYLGLVVTAIPILTQTFAQRWVSAHQAALLYTLEPVFATVFSVWLIGEAFGIRDWIGAGMILSAMVLSQNTVSPKT
jgi:drug/metabolite transporter (DMT)-like permease